MSDRILHRFHKILSERDFENPTNSTNQKWEKVLAQIKEIPRCMACGARQVGPDGVCGICGATDGPGPAIPWEQDEKGDGL